MFKAGCLRARRGACSRSHRVWQSVSLAGCLKAQRDACSRPPPGVAIGLVGSTLFPKATRVPCRGLSELFRPVGIICVPYVTKSGELMLAETAAPQIVAVNRGSGRGAWFQIPYRYSKATKPPEVLDMLQKMAFFDLRKDLAQRAIELFE
jgi:hypothetical protein